LIYLRGNGDGSFKEGIRDDAGDNVTSLTFADVNRDGFADIIAVTSPDFPSSGFPSHISVLLNSFGLDFHLSAFSPLGDDTVIQSVLATTVNNDVFPDLVISVSVPSTDPLSRPSNIDNMFTMLGNGDGTFLAPVPYLAADADLTTLPF